MNEEKVISEALDLIEQGINKLDSVGQYYFAGSERVNKIISLMKRMGMKLPTNYDEGVDASEGKGVEAGKGIEVTRFTKEQKEELELIKKLIYYK